MAIKLFLHKETTYRKEINEHLLSATHNKCNEKLVFHDEIK